MKLKKNVDISIEYIELQKRGKEIQIFLIEEKGEYRDDPSPRKFRLFIPLTNWSIEEVE